MTRLQITLFASLSVTGCAHKQPPVATTAIAPAPAAPAPSPPAVADKAPAPISPNIAATDNIARQCQLRFHDVGDAPKFGFDDFQLLPADRTVLEQVAQCLTVGPLQGRPVSLVGRADPRGTEEYNLGLGTRRAEMVAGYLLHLGVPSSQLSRTTRGALDASGGDETGWQVDRRVDLELSSR